MEKEKLEFRIASEIINFHDYLNNKSIRIKYLKEAILNISMLDYLIGSLKKFKIYKNKTIDGLISKLSLLKNYIYGWKTKEEYCI